ncbi:MAG: DUF3822 family protein [Saprospiraceae bacterium]|nr:DUF3822 family protein [Saprospiraceae bacterium]
MGRINQEIVEFAFSAKATQTYELNILVGSDSVYYLVNDAQLNVLALKSFHFDHRRDKSAPLNLKSVFIEDEILKLPYRVTKIAFTTPHFTLIPSKFYDDKSRLAYFDNMTNLSGFEQFEFDVIKSIESHNVYLVDSSLVAAMKSTFPLAQQHHYMTALILGCQKLAERKEGHQVFANIRDGQVQILFFDHKSLIFANSFPFRTPQDLVYFILNVYEQFKLSPEVTPLSISGSLTEDSDIFKFIYRYVRYINFIHAPSYYRFGQQFTGIPQHFYFDLFSVKLCD